MRFTAWFTQYLPLQLKLLPNMYLVFTVYLPNKYKVINRLKYSFTHAD